MKSTLILLVVVCSMLMLWHPAEIFIEGQHNWFLTKQNTYAQPAKWYVFFTQGFIERITLISLLYYHLRRFWKNLHFLVPFLVYNVWRIFEYWLFAFSIDRYTVILTTIIISVALYAKYDPKPRN